MVGPLRCHGDSTSICMHIVSMHLICAVKNLQKKKKQVQAQSLSNEVVALLQSVTRGCSNALTCQSSIKF